LSYSGVVWEVMLLDPVAEWITTLSEAERDALEARIDLLALAGPSLGRPVIDTLTGSSLANLKEIRSGSVRVLFAFDHEQRAVLLVGGDKRGQWNRWYPGAIRQAELADLRRAQGYTQMQLSKILGVSQGQVSKVERQADLYLSTLASYLEALGAELELAAVLEDGTRVTLAISDLAGGEEVPARVEEKAELVGGVTPTA